MSPTLLHVGMGILTVSSGLLARSLIDAILDMRHSPTHEQRCGCRGLKSFVSQDCPSAQNRTKSPLPL